MFNNVDSLNLNELAYKLQMELIKYHEHARVAERHLSCDLIAYFIIRGIDKDFYVCYSVEDIYNGIWLEKSMSHIIRRCNQ